MSEKKQKGARVRGPDGKLYHVDENDDVFESQEGRGDTSKPGSMSVSTSTQNLPGQKAAKISPSRGLPGQKAVKVSPGKDMPGQKAAKVSPK